jgi:8-oxo-dGTP pyrophosphatase MutT (NUDIX family)
MNIDHTEIPVPLPRLGRNVLGFDLEMANSFRNEAGVICMIGLERYDPDQECCISTIATITRRQEEQDLVLWFLRHLKELRLANPTLKLLSFSGADNDLPWLQERIARYGLPPEDAAILEELEHVDLKREFYRRTQNNNISLKKLEERFGIEREAQLTSKKVSYLLTDILHKDDAQARIPEKIHGYLREDVHHLLVIHERWLETSLEDLHLTEIEYLNLVISLLKLSRRMTQDNPGRLAGRKEWEKLNHFAAELDEALQGALARSSFEAFVLPKLPSIAGKGQDIDRLVKKYVNLKSIQTADAQTRRYRLARALSKPKGVLAVVRHAGKLLMIRRADHLHRAPGFWGLPGGVLEPDETPVQGAVRELLEEVNLKGQAGLLLGTTPSVTNEYELFWVELEIDDIRDLKPRPEEVAEARWVAPGELAALEPLIPGALEGFQRFLGPDWGSRRGSVRRRGSRRASESGPGR